MSFLAVMFQPIAGYQVYICAFSEVRANVMGCLLVSCRDDKYLQLSADTHGSHADTQWHP